MRNLLLALAFALSTFVLGSPFAGGLPAKDRITLASVVGGTKPWQQPGYGICLQAPNLLYPQGSETTDAHFIRLVKELETLKPTFAAVRISLDSKDMVDALGGIHPWGKRYVSTVLLAIKAANLKVHITLPEPTTLESGKAAHRFVMDYSATIFGPTELSWGIRNEPPEWAAGRRDSLTYDLGVADIAHWDTAKYNERGYVLASPSYAGWFFEADPGLESFYNLRFIWDRYLENRIGLTQRTAQAFSFYTHPDWSLVAARQKASGIKALYRKHLSSHLLIPLESGIRYDLYPAKGTEYAKGKATGLQLKMLAEVFETTPYLFDYNGTSALHYKGRSRFIDGVRAGIR